MATTAPSTSDQRLGYRSQETELDLEDLPVRGEVPTWLGGALVRTGPALYEAGTRTVNHLADLLRRHLKVIRSRGRILPPRKTAVIVLAVLRCGAGPAPVARRRLGLPTSP